MAVARRTLLTRAGVVAVAAVAGCLDPFPDPPRGSVVVTNRDDERHEVTLAAGDRERTVDLDVGRQVVVTSVLDGADDLRVRLDGGAWETVPAPGREVHLVVDEAGRLTVADGPDAGAPATGPAGRPRGAPDR